MNPLFCVLLLLVIFSLVFFFTLLCSLVLYSLSLFFSSSVLSLLLKLLLLFKLFILLILSISTLSVLYIIFPLLLLLRLCAVKLLTPLWSLVWLSSSSTSTMHSWLGRSELLSTLGLVGGIDSNSFLIWVVRYVNEEKSKLCSLQKS